MKQDDHGGESSLTHDQQVVGGGNSVVPYRMVPSSDFPLDRETGGSRADFPFEGRQAPRQDDKASHCAHVVRGQRAEKDRRRRKGGE